MKGIFIAYDQAYNMDIANAMEKLGSRGFTMWQDIAGRGTQTGQPHLGNHAWPTMNNAILTFVEDEKRDLIAPLFFFLLFCMVMLTDMGAYDRLTTSINERIDVLGGLDDGQKVEE